ncbi:MAG TPA: sensor histidine kinase [Gammaproteobacteria bacterium]|nr:sensor histidine kinase [Gammaproteobacteria bacterium]
MSPNPNSAWQSLTRPLVRLHHWLLGENNWVGWTPYLWLPYVGFLFIDWYYRPVYWPEHVATITAVGVFLVLYFAGYRAYVGGMRVKIVAGLTALGLILMPVNAGGAMFCMYAMAFTGFMGSMRRGFITLASIVALVILNALLFQLGFWHWFGFVFFGLIIGMSNIYFGEMSRKNRTIKQSQEEIRHLATTAERERIARDLHDLLGHTLTLVTVKAELAARLAERDIAEAAREIRELERISRDALKLVREAVGGYRNGGLAGELANARVALKAANVELSLDSADCGLPPTHENLLAMVLREAVTNVVRHARAQRCRIQLEVEAGVVRLAVEDDGRGGSLKEGNGIGGMRERLAALDGFLDIESGRAGTRLMAHLPLPDREFAGMSGRGMAGRSGPDG